MSLNFAQLLQESLNFTRNQRALSLTTISLITLTQIASAFAMPTLNFSPENMNVGEIFPLLLPSIFSAFISVWLILNIQSISQGKLKSITQNIPNALAKLIPVLFLQLIIIIPLSFGMAAIVAGKQTGDSLSLIGLPLLITGIFITLRLSVAIFAMLIENLTISKTLTFAWQLTKGKMLIMVLYSLIYFLLPFMLNSLLAQLGNPNIFIPISIVLSSVLNYFLTVFGVRFYQALRAINA